MRRTKQAAVVLVAAGLLFGASGTALAVGNDTTPAPTPSVEDGGDPPRDVASPRPTGVDAPPATGARPVPTQTVDGRDVREAKPARPVPGDPSFTG